MPTFPVDRETLRNAEPRRWLLLYSRRAFSYFQIADFVKLDSFKARISNRQRITGYGIACLELMLCLSACSDADQELSDFSSDSTLNSQ